MRSLERVRALVAGQPVDHLPVQPVVMMFAARHLGIPFIDYTRDGRKMAAAQSKLVHDFGIDCLLTCSDPAREVIDIAGEGSVNWYEDQGPAICEERAALLDKSRLKTFRIPDPLGGGRMHDRIKGIEIMHQEFGGEVSIVGWVEGPLALAAELRGLTRSMTDFLDDPAFIEGPAGFYGRSGRRLCRGGNSVRRRYHRHERRRRQHDGAKVLPRVSVPPATAGGGIHSSGPSGGHRPAAHVRKHRSLDSANEATARADLRIGFAHQSGGGAGLPGTGPGDSGQCLDDHRHVGRKPGAGL